MQSLEIDHAGVAGMKAQHKLAIVMDIDTENKYIDCMNDWFLDGSRVFMQGEFMGQGYKDLYMLANIRGSLSESSIA